MKISDFVPPIVTRAAKYVLNGAARRRRDAVIPPSEEVKHGHVQMCASRFGIRTFVETGTYFGDMLNAVRKHFKTLYSVELSRDLYERAVRWFADVSNVQLIHGDSGKVIADLAKKIDEPCLFWLDAHYSGGVTARGDVDTPVLQELANILSRPFRDVILIDDARFFIGLDDYPTLASIEAYVRGTRPDYTVHVDDDIIFIHASTPLIE